MKKFWKFAGCFALVVFILLEIAFVFVLPNVVNINDYKADIQKAAKEQGMVNLDFVEAKIITTPLFGVGAQIKDIKVTLEDGSSLFSSDKVKVRLSLPSLLLLTVKVSCFDVDNPVVNLEVAKNDFKLLTLVENIINQQKNTLQVENPAPEMELPLGIKMEWIKIKVPAIRLNNYKVLITDLETKHYLDLNGEELLLGYFNGKTLKLKTNAGLYSDEDKNISLNVDVDTAIPVLGTQLDEEDDKAEMIDIPFFNPVEAYRAYNLKANLDTKLRVRYSERNGFSSFGHFNLENLTMNIAGIQLPESYIKANTFGRNVWLDTDIELKADEKINLLGRIKYGKHPNMDLDIKTDKIYLQDLLDLAKAFLASFDIPNELNKLSAGGYFQANAYIKTNFKKLKSNGNIELNGIYLAIKDLGKVISDANIKILLENNALDVKNSSLKVGGAKIWADGGINDKSYVDIDVVSEPISLPVVFNAFAPEEIKKAFKLSDGKLKLDVSLTGKLKKAYLDSKFVLKNLNLADSANFFAVNNGELAGSVVVNPKNINIDINNKDFAFFLPQSKSKIVAKNAKINIDSKNIVIAENEINVNDKSIIKYRGNVKNYPKLENIAFSADGNLYTDDLVKFIGGELGMYIHNSGVLPVTVSLNGNEHKQTLTAKLISDANNFITPFEIAELNGKDIVWRAVVDFKKNHLKVKDTGLYTRTISYDKKGKEVEHLKSVADVEGTLVNTRINRLKIHLYDALSGNIYVFPKSSFVLQPTRINIFGQTYEPRFLGNVFVENLSIPELFLNLDSLRIRMDGQRADFSLENVLVNGSDFDINGAMDLVLSDIITLPALNINSKYLDADKVLKVADAAMKYVPAAPANSEPADIPIKISSGDLNMSKIKSGAINIEDVNSRIALNRNVFYLEDLNAKIFGGRVRGDISMNLLTSLLDVKVTGRDIKMEKMLLEAAAMKDTLSGKTSFETDISLKGATYEEQVKSLKGNISFLVKDGQFGPFGKIENLILAENIRESEFFKTALGGVVESLATIDTTHFQNLQGKVNFENGICNIEEITSEGKVLALHLFGEFNILKNTADMKVRAKMSSIISTLLGPIAMINPVNIMNSAAGMNVVTAKAFSLFCETLTPEEANTLPSFSNKYVDNSAMKFQLGVSGDVAKPLSLIKSFKWLATQNEIDLAQAFVDSIPEPIEGSTATTIEEVIAENKALEAEKKTFKYKVTHIFSKKEKSTKEKVEQKVQAVENEAEKVEEVIDSALHPVIQPEE